MSFDDLHKKQGQTQNQAKESTTILPAIVPTL